jgi:hypothetical protein
VGYWDLWGLPVYCVGAAVVQRSFPMVQKGPAFGYCLIIGGLFLVALSCFLRAQTQLDPSQLKVPVVVQFATCQGSGTGTIPNCTPSATNSCTYQWNCAGLSMFQFKLPNGTIAGPYIAIPITPPGSTGAVTWINQLVTVPPQ